VIRSRLFAPLATAGGSLIVAATVALGATLAVADNGTISIVKATSSHGQIQAVVRLEGGALDAGADPSSATMTFDGQDLPTSAKAVNDVGSLNQVAILTIDTSGSMRGAGIEDAKAAATTFLAGMPNDVRVGLITISTTARVVVAPTTDYGRVAGAINRLTAGGATALYDAVALSAKQVSTADLASVLVLSDGANQGGSTTLGQAVRAARHSGATFDAVSIGTDQTHVAPLRAITAATGGTVTTSSGGTALTNVFDQAARSIANQVVVTGSLPSNMASTSGNVTVTMRAGNTTYSDVAYVSLIAAPEPHTAAPTPEAVAAPSAVQQFAGRTLWLALAMVLFGLVVMITIAISAVNRRDRSSRGLRSRLSIYTLTGRPPVKEDETTALGDSAVARSAVELANKVVARRDFEALLEERLDSAAVPLKPAEWLLLHVGIGIGAALLFFFVFNGGLVATLLGLTIGLISPWAYLSVRTDRRRAKFLEQLPNTLQLMAGGLAAGYSMPQAADTVVREGEPPIASEFNRALVETRLGVQLEEALDGIANRMHSQDFTWVVMAIRIQREVGGNLAEVLNTVAATLRERERLHRQVRVLSAEGRLSAWILAGLPVVFAAYLLLARPEYLEPMVTDPIGWVLLAMIGLFMVVGGLWLRQIVKVEV